MEDGDESNSGAVTGWHVVFDDIPVILSRDLELDDHEAEQGGVEEHSQEECQGFEAHIAELKVAEEGHHHQGGHDWEILDEGPGPHEDDGCELDHSDVAVEELKHIPLGDVPDEVTGDADDEHVVDKVHDYEVEQHGHADIVGLLPDVGVGRGVPDVLMQPDPREQPVHLLEILVPEHVDAQQHHDDQRRGADDRAVDVDGREHRHHRVVHEQLADHVQLGQETRAVSLHPLDAGHDGARLDVQVLRLREHCCRVLDDLVGQQGVHAIQHVLQNVFLLEDKRVVVHCQQLPLLLGEADQVESETEFEDVFSDVRSVEILDDGALRVLHDVGSDCLFLESLRRYLSVIDQVHCISRHQEVVFLLGEGEALRKGVVVRKHPRIPRDQENQENEGQQASEATKQCAVLRGGVVLQGLLRNAVEVFLDIHTQMLWIIHIIQIRRSLMSFIIHFMCI